MSDSLSQHISKEFDQDLEDLRQMVFKMGGLIEDQVKKAVSAITTANVEEAQQVIKTEDEVDQLEIDIDAMVTNMIALRNPAASDLRFLVAVSKTNIDLERMGDEASKIAHYAVKIANASVTPKGLTEVKHLGVHVQQALNKTLDAIVRLDDKTALEVMKEDKAIDEEYEAAVRLVITYMMEDPKNIKRALDVIWSLRSLERIGDHARNLAEQVIYYVRGIDIRHQEID